MNIKKNVLGFIIVLAFVFVGFTAHADESVPVDPSPLVDPIPVVDPTPDPDPVPVLVESILIRDGATVVYSGTVNLPEAGTVSILDKNNVSHDVNTRSVLGVLYALDQSSDSFSISNIQYYDSFGSFYLKCITPISSTESCDNWQYVVNSATPLTGIDTTILAGGENIGIYFGSPYRINLDKNSVTTNDSIVATAQKYNYTDDTWSLRNGVTVGVTQPDPSNPWTPNTISEVAVDSDGRSALIFANPGDYNIGIKEDYYFPVYPITVTAPVVSGGGGGSPVVPVFSVSNANSFLSSKQSPDGSFGDMLYSDWVAISGSASDASFNQSLKNYLQNSVFNSSVVTDNERHAMALMAQGINPYTGTSVNYIQKIVDSFDGTQIGESSLINDDVFGLIVLGKAGYTKNDDLISKDILYVLSKQATDGSFENSIDMTSAAIQALRMYSGNNDAISRAENYLIANQNQSDGGYGNNFSTSWALQAMLSNGSLSSNTTRATNFLAIKQQVDGGMEDVDSDISNRIWSTSYAIPAAMNKSWVDILKDFEKPIVVIPSKGKNIVEDTKISDTKKADISVIDEVKKEIPIIKPADEIKIIKPIYTKPAPIKKIIVKEVIKEATANKDLLKYNDQTAGAANSVASDKIPQIARAIWTGITSIFKSILSYF